MKDLLVCIAHHSAPGRLPYLRRVLNAFSEYELVCDIIIDTNVAGLDVRGQNITTVHHASLAHPFFLCWQHRRHMKERIEDYKWFMYIEDDIYLPFENFVNYQRNFELLWPDYVPSFIRVEEFEGEEYVLDVTQRQEFNLATVLDKSASLLVESAPTGVANRPLESFLPPCLQSPPQTEGADAADQIQVLPELHQVSSPKSTANELYSARQFCTLRQPYHGFWIMPQWALKQTMTPDFVRPSDSREAAASFPMWELNKTPVVQLDGGQVSRKCFAFHISNNYASCPTSPHAKIRVADIFL